MIIMEVAHGVVFMPRHPSGITVANARYTHRNALANLAPYAAAYAKRHGVKQYVTVLADKLFGEWHLLEDDQLKTKYCFPKKVLQHVLNCGNNLNYFEPKLTILKFDLHKYWHVDTKETFNGKPACTGYNVSRLYKNKMTLKEYQDAIKANFDSKDPQFSTTKHLAADIEHGLVILEDIKL